MPRLQVLSIPASHILYKFIQNYPITTSTPLSLTREEQERLIRQLRNEIKVLATTVRASMDKHFNIPYARLYRLLKNIQFCRNHFNFDTDMEELLFDIEGLAHTYVLA